MKEKNGNPKGKSWFLVLVSAFIVLTFLGGLQTAASAAKEPVIVGAICPITGPNAEWGRKNRIALQMLEKEVNAAGGVKGHPVKILIYDSAQDAKQVASLVRKLAMDDKAIGIAGPLFSSMCEVGFPVANREGIVSISQASAKPGVAAKNRPWGFRNTIDEYRLAIHTVPLFVKMFNIKTLASIYDIEDATSTVLGKKILPKLAQENGIDVVNFKKLVTFRSEDADVSAQVTKLASYNVDGIIMGADYGPASVVIREMNKQGLVKPVVGGTPLISETILGAAGKCPVMAPATFYSGVPDPVIQDFIKRFRMEAKKAGLKNLDPTMYDVNISDNAKMIIQAAAETNTGLTRKSLKEDRIKVREYVKNLTDAKFKGLSGFRGFNKDGDGLKKIYLLLIEPGSGKWKVAKDL